MKRFEELTYIGQVRRLHRLAKTALRAYGLVSVRAKLIKYREHATTFQIEALGGTNPNSRNDRYVYDRYLLRIHGPGYATATSIASELEWLMALCRDTDIAVPEPIPTLEGNPLNTCARARSARAASLFPTTVDERKNIP